MISSINLPNPLPLLPSLLEAGFNQEIAVLASKLYQQRAEEFKRRTEATIVAAWERIGTLPGASALPLDPHTRKDVPAFTEVYLRCLGEWREEMLQLLKQASKVPSKAAPPRHSRSFNHEYLPLLERFFEENPFPTHADKVFLANKSNMQYRQIHVWFQNRRNRTKKEAKPLKKKPMRMQGFAVNPAPRTYTQESLSGVNNQPRFMQSSVPKCIVTSPPPPHAFPSSYPPTCAYDPFPCKSAPASFKRPEWRRKSCSNPPLSIPISIDELIEKFSQCNVRGDTRNKGAPRPLSQAATAAITVIPCRAPHPSLIVRTQSKWSDVRPSVRASTSRLHGSGPSLKPITPTSLIVPFHRSELPAKRKTAPLPRHISGRILDAERDTTPSERPSASASSCKISAVFTIRV